jgi:hypothetical protein
MNFASLGKAYLICLVLTPFFSWNARAQEPAPLVVLQMEPPSGTEVSTDTPLIQVQFEDPEGKLEKDKILMEVDRGDVTALAQYSSGSFLYQPSLPLPPGEHEVRITGTLSDGTPFQDVTWSFKVIDSANPRSWTWGLQPSITYEYAIHRETAPQDQTVQSNILFNSQRLGPVQSFFNSTLQGNNVPTQGQSQFDLASFQAGVTTGPSSVLLGDVVVDLDQLSIANLSRRGIFFQQKLPFMDSRFDFFSVRSESIFGFRHGLGVSDSNQRIDGESLLYTPGNSERLGIRFYYLRGENSNFQGFNFGGISRGEKGSAYGANVTSTLFQNQVRAELYTGWSNFNFNAANAAEANQDRGLLLRLSYLSTPFSLGNRSSSFQAQIEVQDIGLFFRSLGNPFLVSDRRGMNINSTWNWGVFGVNGGFSKFHDNVKDSALLPRVYSNGYTAGISFLPVGTTGPPRLPAVNLNYTRTEQQSENDPVGFLAQNNHVETFASLVTMSRNRFNLNCNASYARSRDQKNRIPDTNTTAFTIAALFNPTFSSNLGPSISYSKQKTLATGIDLNLWTYSFTSMIPLFQNTFIVSDQIGYSTTASSESLNKSSSMNGTLQLNWNLNQTWQNRASEVLYLRVSYNRNVVLAPTNTSLSGLEIFGGLTLTWPFQ